MAADEDFEANQFDLLHKLYVAQDGHALYQLHCCRHCEPCFLQGSQ
jgi:hypothetical protein